MRYAVFDLGSNSIKCVMAETRAGRVRVLHEESVSTRLAEHLIDTCELRPVDTGDDVWEYFTHLRWLYDHQDDMPGWIGSSAEAVRLLAAAAP